MTECDKVSEGNKQGLRGEQWWEVSQSGCRNKGPQTGWLINNVIYCLIVLEGGSPRWGCRRAWVRTFFLVQTAYFSLCPHTAEGARELSGVPLIRGPLPFMSSTPHDLITSQGPQLLTASHWELICQHMRRG